MFKDQKITIVIGFVASVLLLLFFMFVSFPQDRISTWMQRDLLPKWQWAETKISIFSIELSEVSHTSLPAVRIDVLRVNPDWSSLVSLGLRWKVEAVVAGQYFSGILNHSDKKYQFDFSFESVDLAKLVSVVISKPIPSELLAGSVSGNGELLFDTSSPSRARVSFEGGHISSVGLSLSDITGSVGLMNKGRWEVALQSREGVVLEGKGGLKYSVNSSPVLSGSVGLQAGGWSPLNNLLNGKDLKLDLKGSLVNPIIRCNLRGICASFM